MSMQYYDLDPVHFLTIADMTWHAGLKFTCQELKLFSKVEDYVLLESQMRGGMCFLAQRYARANNPYLSCYNPSEPSSYIVNLDVNNLYGFCMCEHLPVGDFRWLSSEEIAVFDVSNISRYSPTGYLLEIFTNDVYKDFKNEFSDIMDLSNYPSTSKFFNSENNNKLGYLKDETKSQPILEFIGLRCKMYSYKCENSETKKAKGVKKAV
ncbi:uncharacterized protein TNCT_315781 [Trichonephila clavata]|uniref:DNA-directed DNA polymerase n=1 Tax=Trichonephila clavata TaxID=2740835 RepID=A0A8X6FRN9_TRICU|nr:uncharacterized protein TNCT_315781 [Trichonephila clavata]